MRADISAEYRLSMRWTAPTAGIAVGHIAVAVEGRRESAYGWKRSSDQVAGTTALGREAGVVDRLGLDQWRSGGRPIAIDVLWRGMTESCVTRGNPLRRSGPARPVLPPRADQD